VSGAGAMWSGGVTVGQTLGAFTAMQNRGKPPTAVRRPPFSNGGATPRPTD